MSGDGDTEEERDPYLRAIAAGCVCAWETSNVADRVPHIASANALCPIHNSQSLDRQIDYGRIEEIVRRVVREEKGR